MHCPSTLPLTFWEDEENSPLQESSKLESKSENQDESPLRNDAMMGPVVEGSLSMFTPLSVLDILHSNYPIEPVKLSANEQ